MDIGIAITASTGIASGLVFTYKLIVLSRNGNGNGVKTVMVPRPHCDDHSGVCADIKNIKDSQERIELKLDRAIERREIGRG